MGALQGWFGGAFGALFTSPTSHANSYKAFQIKGLSTNFSIPAAPQFFFPIQTPHAMKTARETASARGLASGGIIMYVIGKMRKERSIEGAGPSGPGDVTSSRSQTMSVLALLALTALTFSYLGSYAIYNTLVAADVLSRYQGPDPRPRWLVTGFCVLMLAFMVLAEVFRRLSRRQMRAIDAMADAEDVAF